MTIKSSIKVVMQLYLIQFSNFFIHRSESALDRKKPKARKVEDVLRPQRTCTISKIQLFLSFHSLPAQEQTFSPHFALIYAFSTSSVAILRLFTFAISRRSQMDKLCTTDKQIGRVEASITQLPTTNQALYLLSSFFTSKPTVREPIGSLMAFQWKRMEQEYTTIFQYSLFLCYSLCLESITIIFIEEESFLNASRDFDSKAFCTQSLYFLL